MVIRLKKKIKSFLTNIWLIEILIFIFVCIFFGIEIYKNSYTKLYSRNLTAIEATINPIGFYREQLINQSKDLKSSIYEKTNKLSTFNYGSAIEKVILKDYFLNNKYNKESEKNPVYFVIRDKNTGEIITNDSSNALDVTKGRYSDTDIRSYINRKYNGQEVVISYDNSNENPNEVIINFEEYYYTSVNRYKDENYLKIAIYMGIMIGAAVLIFIKSLLVLIMNKGRIYLRGNFINSIYFVLKYGFSYKHTRKTLVISFMSLTVFFISYLYLLATSGGYENNILSNFFSTYPFKGSFLLMLLPMIGVTYSLKKSIEIIMVNESIKKANDGELDYRTNSQSGPEIIELVENIAKIRSGYEIAVEDALRNEKLKTELISNVSHDLRTPLTSIINYVNILKENITEEERKDYLEIVDKKAKKLKVLIDDLFEMSKINSGKIELSKEKIGIISLVHQAIGEYSYLYEDKNIEFKVESFSEEIYMLLDGKMMSRAIENIVINALKYSLDGTRVYVDITKDESDIVISFKNISNYDMNFDNEDIFERFARGDSSRATKVEGSGLGLAITKSIVELHNGNVFIKREGDMFKIYLHLPIELNSIE